MSIRKSTDQFPNDLNDAEIEFGSVKGNVPEAMRQDTINGKGKKVGVRTAYLSKMGRMYRAEFDAWSSMMEAKEGEAFMEALAQARADLEASQRKALAMEAQLIQKDREIERRTATPALVVHSGDG